MSREKAQEDRERYFVSDGISHGETWMTCVRTPRGSLRRVVSPALPLRATREEAEQDLLRWLGEEEVRK